MNVGLFLFFIQAWAEKAGYINNLHSSDEIDLPFEFAGTMLGFWMARVLTKPFDERSEKFRSTLFIDLVSSGVIGLFYTLIVGPLTESVTSSVAHGLRTVVPHSLDIHEYTPFQRHMRPLELLVLAGGMWWSLNRFSKSEQLARLSSTQEAAERDSEWEIQITIASALVVTISYLVILAMMLTILEAEGLGWTLGTAVGGIAVGTAALLFAMRVERRGLTTVLGGNGGESSG